MKLIIVSSFSFVYLYKSIETKRTAYEYKTIGQK